MNLMLAPQELNVLLWAIDGAISDLGTEIGHTDNRVMREDLRERKAILSMLHDRLNVPMDGELPICENRLADRTR